MNIVELTKMLGVKHLEGEAAQFLLEKVNDAIEDQQESRKEFAEAIRNLSDERLKEFIPDVYQKDIYSIDYALLKEKGIKLLSKNYFNEFLINFIVLIDFLMQKYYNLIKRLNRRTLWTNSI